MVLSAVLLRPHPVDANHSKITLNKYIPSRPRCPCVSLSAPEPFVDEASEEVLCRRLPPSSRRTVLTHMVTPLASALCVTGEAAAGLASPPPPPSPRVAPGPLRDCSPTGFRPLIKCRYICIDSLHMQHAQTILRPFIVVCSFFSAPLPRTSIIVYIFRTRMLHMCFAFVSLTIFYPLWN